MPFRFPNWVDAHSFSSFHGGVIEHPLSSAGWTEIAEQILAAPGCLDDQDRLAQRLFHVNAEREFRTNLSLRGAEACCQFVFLLGRIVAGTADRRNPDLLAHPWRAVGIAHLLEDR